MRVLSVRAPWAFAICCGAKNVENRSRKTNLRERVLIHVCKAKPEDDIYSYMTEQMVITGKKHAGEEFVEKCSSNLGCIIGSVEIADCVTDSKSIWAEEGMNHYILKDAQLFKKPIENVRGQLGFWNYDGEIEPYNPADKYNITPANSGVMPMASKISIMRNNFAKSIDTLGTKEMRSYFSKEESIQISYKPLIFTRMALNLIPDIKKLCIENKCDFRKVFREMEELQRNWECEELGMRKSHEDMRSRFLVQQFTKTHEWDYFTLHNAIKNEIMKRYPNYGKSYDMLATTAKAIILLSHVLRLENSIDNELHKRTGYTNLSSVNEKIQKIRNLLDFIMEGIKVPEDDNTKLGMRILNKKLSDWLSNDNKFEDAK